jgi:hypothetical protein
MDLGLYSLRGAWAARVNQRNSTPLPSQTKTRAGVGLADEVGVGTQEIEKKAASG